MKSPFVAAVAAAAVLVPATVVTATALSQGEGPPTGTLVVKVKLSDVPSSHGLNAATPRNKKRPVVADMVAGTATLVGGHRGRGYDFQVVSYPGPKPRKRYKGGSATLGLTMYDFTGGDRLWLSCLRPDAPVDNPCAILGGTGRYAGARGTAVEGNFKDARHSQTFTTTFTFVP
jgi:hypothetical protein